MTLSPQEKSLLEEYTPALSKLTESLRTISSSKAVYIVNVQCGEIQIVLK